MQTSETMGLNAMADALVASGRLTRESATQMLQAEIAAHDSAQQDALEFASPSASNAPARDAQGRWASADATSASFVRSDASPTTSVRTHASLSPPVRPEPVEGHVPRGGWSPEVALPSTGSGRTQERNAIAQDLTTQDLGADDPATNAVDNNIPDPNPTPLADIEIDPLFAPPATPEGYHLTLTPGVKMDVADVQAVRGWFHTLRLPQPIAQSIYSDVERMSTNPPAEADIARMNAATMSELTYSGANTEHLSLQSRYKGRGRLASSRPAAPAPAFRGKVASGRLTPAVSTKRKPDPHARRVLDPAA